MNKAGTHSARIKWIVAGGLIILILLFFLDLMIGEQVWSAGKVFGVLFSSAEANELSQIMHLFRMPRALTAVLAGAALSVSGLLMQTLFRNPLAGPYILGISAGAGLGVALAILGAGSSILFLQRIWLNNLMTVGAAAAGAAMVMLIVMLISLRNRDVMTLLILGVLIGFAVSAIIGLLQYFSKAGQLKLYVIWSMGSLRGMSMHDLKLVIPVVLLGLILAWLISRNLNLLLLGEKYARTMGSHILGTRVIIFVSVSLLAGSITAFCGPIGFLGIAVPHMVRSIIKSSDHFHLIPLTSIFGAAIMLISDILTNLGPSGSVLPINSITALIGIPFIIWIILGRKKTHF